MEKYTDLFESSVKVGVYEGLKNVGKLIFSWAKSDVVNKNKRFYPHKILTKAVEAFNGKLEKTRVAGQADHPLMAGGTQLHSVSHVLQRVWMDKDLAYAEAILLPTTAGKDTRRLIDAQVPLGASLRGFGEVGSDGRVKDNLEIASIDLVANPSFGSDAQIGTHNIVIESTILDEAFFSLRDGLQTEIIKKFGKDHWVVDFSDQEVVFRKEGTEGYKKISYKTKEDDLELTGEPKTVERKVKYESGGELSQDEKRQAGIYSGRQILQEKKIGQRSKQEAQHFTEAIMSGYKGNFEAWKKEFGGEDA